MVCLPPLGHCLLSPHVLDMGQDRRFPSVWSSLCLNQGDVAHSIGVPSGLGHSSVFRGACLPRPFCFCVARDSGHIVSHTTLLRDISWSVHLIHWPWCPFAHHTSSVFFGSDVADVTVEVHAPNCLVRIVSRATHVAASFDVTSVKVSHQSPKGSHPPCSLPLRRSTRTPCTGRSTA